MESLQRRGEMLSKLLLSECLYLLSFYLFEISIHSLLTGCGCFGWFNTFLSHPPSRVCKKVGVCVHGSPDSVLCQENVAEVYGFLHNSMNDYMVDSRGDVGAWSVHFLPNLRAPYMRIFFYFALGIKDCSGAPGLCCFFVSSSRDMQSWYRHLTHS